MKRWVYRGYDAPAAERLTKEAGVTPLLGVLLAQRGITDPDEALRFLRPKISQLHDPYAMRGMRETVDRIRQAIAQQEKILLYGDYDVDGTVSIVLLRSVIELAGGQADFHVPHRVREGYGMRTEVIEKAAADGVRLIITADNGIRENEVVGRANELGVNVIITDHHLPKKIMPAAFAVLNPNQPDCGYPDKNLCGAGVVFKLAQALFTDLGWEPAKRDRVLTSLLKMVAIATIADMVPLKGENRIFAKLGLEGLRSPQNLGLKALIGVSGLSVSKKLGAGDVGFRIGPRLNAAGRLDDARAVIELFSAQTQDEVARLAGHLDLLNSRRQSIEESIVNKSLEQLGDVAGPDEMPFLVVDGDDWHAGVIGIVASRIVERFHRPALVLSRDPASGLATGSGRSIPSFHLLQALESTADLFTRFGGHRQAAGCTLPGDRIPELRKRLNEHARGILSAEDFVPVLSLDKEISLSDVNEPTLAELGRLAPFGLGNPTPKFCVRGAMLLAEPEILKMRHVKMRLGVAADAFSAVAWRMAEYVNGIGAGSSLDVAFSIERDDYRGGLRLNVDDFRPAEKKVAVA
jgi:single-stranded-DNA-specific exonuclease